MIPWCVEDGSVHGVAQQFGARMCAQVELLARCLSIRLPAFY
jgi:hypothetical protein